MDFADDDTGYGKSKTPKVAKVKDKTPAPVQITAEQLLREAKERELELVQAPPRQKISDAAELRDYQMRKRKAFEDNIRKNRFTLSNWLKYAAWEETQKALRNARSVYERAIDVDHRAPVVWLKYADMEMRNKQVNSARNILDRAVSILPRVDQFWRKYAYMEETLNNIAGCRQVFERWMEWRPNEQAWHAYINFELRYKELDNARMIYERFVVVHPEVQNWIKYARFEEKHGYIASARRIFERANEYFGTEHLSEQFVIAFARFEENQKEHERVRTIYKWAINHFDKEKCRELYRLYTIHEKKYGDQSSIEGALVEKRKNHYEEELKSNPYNYDAWFNYIRLMEEHGNPDVVRELYERAIANIPLKTEKRYWRRYIYLWIYYAIYEELEMKDIDRARQVYKTCLDNIPHKVFTFAKVWVMFAKFEIRDKHLDIARKILGSAIGKCPKDKLFREYINLEFQLKEFGRCRTLYHKFLEFSPENCRTWIEFAEMETNLTDVERARAIYELAITQKLDMPEVMWKAYIDFETGLDEYDKVRDIYKRLLERTPHIKVWLSYALFELSTDEDCIDRSRQVYKTANKFMKERKNEERVAMQNHEEWETLKKTRDEERATLLEKWLEFENEFGDDESLAAIQKLQPRKEVRSRASKADGSTVSWEEHYEYVFPDEENTKIYSNLRAKALNYELQKAKAS